MNRDQQSPAWFLAQLKPNSHKLAEVNLARQGFKTFLPLQEQTHRLRGQFRTEWKPMFPGYVFVAVDLALGRWRAINATRGVTRLVGFGGDPVAVPASIMAGLMGRCDPQSRRLAKPGFAAGDAVHVKTGPFANFVATVERLAPDQRIWVLLDLMGRETRVAVDPDMLQRL